ncbi:hypothetical protein SK128_007356 [Halocaridina rubra]|uniref:Ionotropic glutamate receptor C-terminal domain-containing protein n=1 Tax=Halocaridina rubra TaxID=373956 RepID=A0AAN8ZYQ4_HALRR
MSVKVITGIWLLFCLIIGTLYRSNLKAMLILPKIHLPFTNLEELVEAGLTTYVLEGSFLANAVLDAPGNSTLGRFRKQTLINDNVEENIREMFRGRIVGFGSYSALIGLINQDFAKVWRNSLA